jgi:methylglutaconyl-CoA hydratase
MPSETLADSSDGSINWAEPGANMNEGERHVTLETEAGISIAFNSQNQGQVAEITLNRPEVRNAFDDSLIQSLTAAFTRLGKDANVRVIILRAAGSAFCAGADLNWMRRSVDFSFSENVQDAHHLAAMLKTIHDCPKPVIARVHGAAFGGGVGLVAACDIALATESAKFCLSETRLGLIPAVISPFVLQKIGQTAARRYFLTAEVFSAVQAAQLNLITEVATDEAALDALLDNMVAAILGNGPEALGQSKVLLEQISHFAWDRAVDITTKMIAERRASAEGQEGMRAFLEKRAPRWQQTEANR